MRGFVIIAGAVAATGVVADPYAGAYREEIVRQYEAERGAFLDEVENLHFAVKCKVFETSGEVTPVIMLRRQRLLGRHIVELSRIGVPPEPALSNGVDAAAQRGYGRGRAPGACDYFHDRPDLVADLRRLARKALGAVSGMR